MQRRVKQVLWSLKEHTRVSVAKIATIGGFCDLDLIVIKATSPEDFPLSDKYVHELLKIFSISPASFRAFAMCFTRRFSKTKCWRVALKSLLLLHRLLRSLPDNTPLRTEILWARSNGYMSLNPCHFEDFSSSASEDYTFFIRSYAHLLDEALDCSWIEHREIEEEEEEIDILPDKMPELGRLIKVLPRLQSLIDRVMDCRPAGAAARSFIVHSAMKHIIRDSFICYTTLRKEIVVVLDNLIQFSYWSCLQAFDIYKKAATQANHLSEFYEWSKSMGFCGFYEYPFVDQIPEIQIRALGTLLNGMWLLTHQDASSTTMSSLTSNLQSPSSGMEDDNDKQLVEFEANASSNQAKFDKEMDKKKLEKVKEMEPLIQLEDDDNNVNWEALLEASLPSPCIASSKNALFFPNGTGYGLQYGNNSAKAYANQVNGGKIQLYNPYVNPSSANPFHHQNNMSNYHGSNPNYPTHPWGL